MSVNKEKAKAWLGTAWRATRAVATGKSKLEILVLDSTAPDVAWGPHGQQLAEISEACFDAEKFAKVWGTILRRYDSPPADWRGIYKALLLTEHLLKTSSQHVVQTLIDGAPSVEALTHFKFLDEKGKDQGINVSNRAKELGALMASPDRIRAERAKAKALKEKLRAAEGTFAVASSGGGGQGFSPAPASEAGASPPRFAGGSPAGASAGGSASGSPRPYGHRALPAVDSDEGEGEGLAGGVPSAQTGRGYAAAAPADPVAATQRRINSLRAAGRLHDAWEAEGAEAGGAAPGMSAAPRSQGSLGGASDSQHGKPSLSELARKSGGPKRLQEVRVNPAIALAIGGARLAPPPGAKPAPAPVPAPAPAPDPTSPSAAPLPSALSNVLVAPAPLATAGSAAASSPSAGGSPWSSGSPAAGVGDPFATSAAQPAAGPFEPFAAPPTKPGAASAGAINLTASAQAGQHALPAYLFAEPTPVAPPSYATAAAGWGSHVSGGGSHSPKHASVALPKPAAVVAAGSPADQFFSDFSPFAK